MELTDKELNKLFEELLGDKRYSFDDVAFEVTKKGEKYLGHPRELIPFEDIKKGMTLYFSGSGRKAGKVKRKIRDMEDLLQYAELRNDQLQLYHTLTYKPERLEKAAQYDWVLYTDILSWEDGVHIAPYTTKSEVKDVSEGWRPSGVGCYSK